MATYYELAHDFYERRPNLLVGMESLTAETLYDLMARDLSLVCKTELGRIAARGIHEPLDPEAESKIEDSFVNQAFAKETAKKRKKILLEYLQEFFADARQHRSPEEYRALRQAYAKMKNAQTPRDLAKNLSANIPELVQKLRDKLEHDASILRQDGPEKQRTNQGLSVDVMERSAAARSVESAELLEARRGLDKAVAFGAVGVNLDDYFLDTDKTPLRRSLLRWLSPDRLARHFPRPKGETTKDLDKLTSLVASRLNYPFGLVEPESRRSMLAAVFLAHSAMPGRTVKKKVNDAFEVSKETGRVVDASNAAIIGWLSKTSPEIELQGLDFLRVVGGVLLKGNEVSDGSGWPESIVGALLRDPEATDTADLIESALPLHEPDRKKKIASWASNHQPWKTYGEICADILTAEIEQFHGGALSNVDDDEQDENLVDDLNYQLAGHQIRSLGQAMPLRVLDEFRNFLVNAETGKSKTKFDGSSILSLNAFLKKRIKKQLSKSLETLRTGRQQTYEGLRTEAMLRFRGDSDSSYQSALDLVINQMEEDNRDYSLALAQELETLEASRVLELLEREGQDLDGTPTQISSQVEPQTVLKAAIELNRRYVGIESPEVLKDRADSWLETLTAPYIVGQLEAFAQADNDQVYVPRSHEAAEESKPGIAGPLLRETAICLQAFTAHSQRLIASSREQTLEAQIKKYFEAYEYQLPRREERERGAMKLSRCLLFDAFLPGRTSDES